MLEDFKKFALRGNVIDLAIGVIIGAAFTGAANCRKSAICSNRAGPL